jgi:hypothetical protein
VGVLFAIFIFFEGVLVVCVATVILHQCPA